MALGMWVVTPSGLVGGCQHFGGKCRLSVPSSSTLTTEDDREFLN
jgi:hypothetical protein